MRHEDASVARVVVRRGARRHRGPTSRAGSRAISPTAMGKRLGVQYAQSSNSVHPRCFGAGETLLR